MLQIVQEQVDPRIGLGGIGHTRRREPAQLVGEQILQHLSEEEGGEGDTDHDQDGDDIVPGRVLVGGGGNAQGNGDEELQYHRHEGDGEGHAHVVADDVDDGRAVLEAGTEIELHQLAEPVDVALQDAHEAVILQTVELLHALHRLLGDGGAALIHLSDLTLDEADGHTSDQDVNDEGYAQKDQHRQTETFQNIL